RLIGRAPARPPEPGTASTRSIQARTRRGRLRAHSARTRARLLLPAPRQASRRGQRAALSRGARASGGPVPRRQAGGPPAGGRAPRLLRFAGEPAPNRREMSVLLRVRAEARNSVACGG